MSFAEDVKNELCQYELGGRPRAEKIELSCLLRMAGSLLIGSSGRVGIRLVTTHNAVARRALGMLRRHYKLETSVLVRQGVNLRKRKVYTVTVEPSEAATEVLKDLHLWPMTAQIPHDWLSGMEVRRAFLRGAFLGGGSVNKPEADYHMEFTTSSSAFADELIYVLGLFAMPGRMTDRKEDYVVYLKDGDSVTNSLQIMGAQSALMAFENVRIMKGVRNAINRQVNCETANLQKVVNAAVRQVTAIRILDREKGLDNLPDKLQLVAKLRLENPEASLKDLEELMEGSLSKSGIGHRLRKLEAMALEIDPVAMAEA